MLTKFFTFSRFTLFIALCISAIAAYYSVIGLTAIFAGAVIPIIVMGAILEIAKITTTVWLHKYWDRASWSIKTYLTAAVIALACLTSMGIFGLLSKAHSDTGLVSGDVVAQLSLIDEKIKIQRDNVDVARKALQQMDDQVNQRLSRSDSEQGAERAVQIRRQQSAERGKLLKEINDAQVIIAKLNEERAPIAAKSRKVEAEVGPIKYIAALIYGDNPDTNLLERAVRWVTILIVVVFDPLAIILILAANNSLKWERETTDTSSEPMVDQIQQNESPTPVDEVIAPIVDSVVPENREIQDIGLPEIDSTIIETVAEQPQDNTPEKTDIQEETEDIYSSEQSIFDPSNVENTTPWPIVWDDSLEEIDDKDSDVVPVQVEGVTREAVLFHPKDEYVIFEGKNISIAALKELHPELILSDNAPRLEILFGTKFPSMARSGDIYIRVDQMPHIVYKFNGSKWIMLDKSKNSTYLQNIAYIQYLISRIDSGEYDPDNLTDVEQEEISDYLRRSH